MKSAVKKRKIGTGRHLKEWEILKGQYEGLMKYRRKDRIICIMCRVRRISR